MDVVKSLGIYEKQLNLWFEFANEWAEVLCKFIQFFAFSCFT
jgi:hypothetical protein